MGNKYFTVSYDDGNLQDKKIVKLLRKYHLGGTFNLNSGLFGSNGVITRIGDIGYQYHDGEQCPKNGILRKYVKVGRVLEEEVRDTYNGFEIASHAYMHENLGALDEAHIKEAIEKDIACLKQYTESPISGFAYPNGRVNEQAVGILRDHNIHYARTIKSTKSFDLPENPYEWNPTCWQGDKDVFQLLDKFLHQESQENQVFYMWGHGYELDYGTKYNNWDRLEEIFKIMSDHEEIICCSNIEVLERTRGI